MRMLAPCLSWPPHRPSLVHVVTCITVLAAACTASSAFGQPGYERNPINYTHAESHDPVAELGRDLALGKVSLAFHPERGYLDALLDHLHVPASTQILVHSKTSLQRRYISPETPRALYFNDETHIGWMPDGEVIEIAATDPQLGTVFYTLEQEESAKPTFVRDQGNCLTCHESSRTQSVPGLIVRSLLVNHRGQPFYGSGTYTIDHTSPFSQRWGGYYITGTHGSMRHLGNLFASSKDSINTINRDPGANVTDITARIEEEKYLSPHSDLVAVMVLEHQSQMQNLIARASYETRAAMHYDQQMSKALERPADEPSELTLRRVSSVCEKLVRYMLFSGEVQLTAPVQGTSSFVKEFSSAGKRDSQGRSLRDFDLQTRMFRFPCSYMIDSPLFQQLPELARQRIAIRLKEILQGEDTSKEFAHLTTEDRAAILQIITETQPNFWQVASAGESAISD